MENFSFCCVNCVKKQKQKKSFYILSIVWDEKVVALRSKKERPKGKQQEVKMFD